MKYLLTLLVTLTLISCSSHRITPHASTGCVQSYELLQDSILTTDNIVMPHLEYWQTLDLRTNQGGIREYIFYQQVDKTIYVCVVTLDRCGLRYTYRVE